LPSSLRHHPATAKGGSADLARTLRAGRVYRREELTRDSNAVDRHLRELVADGTLKKLAPGLYYAPRQSTFGTAPPDDCELVAAFLRDKNFLIFSPSVYNTLGLGTTQLYNRTLVYNHKRHGVFTLGNRQFDCRVKLRFPKKLTSEFLFVDMLNNLDELAEDKVLLLAEAQRRAKKFDRPLLLRVLNRYGSMATKKRVAGWLHG